MCFNILTWHAFSFKLSSLGKCVFVQISWFYFLCKFFEIIWDSKLKILNCLKICFKMRFQKDKILVKIWIKMSLLHVGTEEGTHDLFLYVQLIYSYNTSK